MTVITLLIGCGVNSQPGDGQKIGQIVKLSKVGIVKETWEGQLIRGGMSGGSGSFGTVPFDFTVDSIILLPKVQAAMSNQTEVIISYRSEFVYSAFRSDSSGHFLTGIEEVKK